MRGKYGLRSVIVMRSNQMDITLNLLFAREVHFHWVKGNAVICNLTKKCPNVSCQQEVSFVEETCFHVVLSSLADPDMRDRRARLSPRACLPMQRTWYLSSLTALQRKVVNALKTICCRCKEHLQKRGARKHSPQMLKMYLELTELFRKDGNNLFDNAFK